MTQKSSSAPRMAPLRELALEPITDPREQAALEQSLQQPGEGASPAPVRTRDGISRKPTTSEVLALARRLSPNERQELVGQLIAQLPPEVVHQLVKQHRRRSAKP
jgi:hypothetical protein